jgi:hypothetical protein
VCVSLCIPLSSSPCLLSIWMSPYACRCGTR